jgi:hypothetical protein
VPLVEFSINAKPSRVAPRLPARPGCTLAALRAFVGSLDGRAPVAEERAPADASIEQHRRRPLTS